MSARHRFTLLALACLSAAPATAQVVRGVIVAEGGGHGVNDATVVLVDSAGARVGATVADDSGRFVVSARSAGRYQLLIRRIGFKSSTSPFFALPAGATVEQRIVVSPLAERLAPIVISGASSCEVRPGEGSTSVMMWDEARKALEAVAIAQEQRRYLLTVARFERRLDPRSLKQLDSKRWSTSGLGEAPFRSLSADEFARDGYVRVEGRATMFYAPDATVLLSERFLEDHCLRAEQNKRNDGPGSALVGVAFEPTATRSHPEVAGTFWLDPSTHELRTLEFRYTSLPGGVSRTAEEQLGGQVHFARAPNGGWLIQQWTIRTREIVRGTPPPGARDQTPIELVSAIKETGGEVTSIQPGDSAQLLAKGMIQGTIADSAGLANLSSATILIRGAGLRTNADATGRYSFPDLLPGDYTLTVVNPALAAVELTLQHDVTVRAGDTVTTDFALPSRQTILSTVCSENDRGTSGALLGGIVRDAVTNEAIPDATITFEWERPDAQNQLDARKAPDVPDSLLVQGGRADAAGGFHACGVPSLAPTLITATDANGNKARAVMEVSPSDLTVRDLRIARPGPGEPIVATAGVRVYVSTPDQRPAARAAVKLVGTSIGATTGEDGTAHLGEVPAGTQVVEVRNVGYQPYRTTVELVAGKTLPLDAPLTKQLPMLAMVKVVGARDPNGTMARRRSGNGVYIGPQELEKAKGQSLSNVLRHVPGLEVISGPGGTSVHSYRRNGAPTTFNVPTAGTSANPAPGGGTGSPSDGSTGASSQRGTSVAVSKCGAPLPAIDQGGGGDPAHPQTNAACSSSCTLGSVNVVVDGHDFVPSLGGIDAEFKPEEIRAIEVFRGPSEVPVQWAKFGSNCGLLAIWLKKKLGPEPTPESKS